MNAQTTQHGTAEKVANAIIKSGFWQGANAHAVLLMCYLAEAEGKHPAIVYRDYHMMNGKPAKKADAMLSDFVKAGGKVEWHTLDDKCADATFSHPSGAARITWTTDRAKQAGLRSPMWTKYPRQMLRSRTISEGVRTVFPGATSGLYEEGEVADIVAEEAPNSIERPANETATLAMPEEREGHSHEGAVSPPAYAFPEGPAKNITDLKTRCRPLWREIEGCGDASELEPFLESEETKALLKQLEALENPTHRRELWTGDGKDNPGIEGLIARKRKLFDMHAISGGQYQEKENA